MPSPDTSRENLQKAKAAGKPPRPWRSQAESRAIRMFTWQWHLRHGPWCSARALARWLGVSHTYIQKLARTLSRDESDFLREVDRFGPPTIEALRRAREESHRQRERGLLRRQRRWKTVEYRIGNTVLRDFVLTEPNAATLVANNRFLPDAPTPAIVGEGKLDYNAMHMWNLRINGASENETRQFGAARVTRWRFRRPFRRIR
jgi:hypothetical protein